MEKHVTRPRTSLWKVGRRQTQCAWNPSSFMGWLGATGRLSGADQGWGGGSGAYHGLWTSRCRQWGATGEEGGS